MGSLLKTRLFQNFFGTLGFTPEVREAATMSLYDIAQKYDQSCCLATHPVSRVAKIAEGVITYSSKDI